ncbi:GntR family transcriptional regulator [Microbacterium sp. RG1]|uniref:GntR family transcriptional regulator n=1 Tax=Microbacterium sp. RG1 TaxID=2489212 RepID=UPI0010CA4A4E|nr:GntR family transcriptional regulator [Microbacterium sp. RG1]QCQ17459.1 GntR family transcriptional regulator [Microbacterium sp. RG1]
MADHPTSRPPRRRRMLGDEVFELLGRAIRDGKLAPGQSLRDVELAERFGISRTPVREALQRLERIGLVEISANRFTRVTVPTERLVADTRAFIVGFTAEALRAGLPTCSDEQLTLLVAAYDRMLATPVGTGGHTEASTAFFRTLSMATGNIVLGRFIRETSLTLERNLQGWAFIDVTSDMGRRAGDALRGALVSRNAARGDAILRSYHRRRSQ